MLSNLALFWEKAIFFKMITTITTPTLKMFCDPHALICSLLKFSVFCPKQSPGTATVGVTILSPGPDGELVTGSQHQRTLIGDLHLRLYLHHKSTGKSRVTLVFHSPSIPARLPASFPYWQNSSPPLSPFQEEDYLLLKALEQNGQLVREGIIRVSQLFTHLK